MSEPSQQPEAAPRPFVLGVVGDSGSGKSTVAAGVRALVGPARVATLQLDDYHRYTRAERQALGMTALNPAVHNLGLMQEHLQLLRRGRPIRNRPYDHTDGSFGPPRTVEPGEVVIVRGLLGFPTDELKEAYDLAVFLHPEPELLFRWKLRRDVKTRGYTEAQVLKHIAQHLLDSKQYVVPQADRADVVVKYEIPEWDATDAEVRVSVVLRGPAADVVRGDERLARFEGHVERQESPEEVVLRAAPSLTQELLDEWALERFPDTYRPEDVGQFMDQDGEIKRLPQLAFAQVLIAALANRLRAAGTAPSTPPHAAPAAA